MRKLLNNLGKKEIVLIFVCFILVCGQVWLELRMPEYMSEITVLVETDGSRIEDILNNGLGMIVCALLSLILAVFVGFLTSDISARFSMSIRKRLFEKVNDLDIESVEKFSTSSLVTRTTNDITQIQMFVSMGLQLLLKAPIMTILVIIKILETSWQWSIITLICMSIIVCVISAIIIFVIPKFRRMQKLTDDINDILRENLNGIHVVKAFDAENYEEKKFAKINYNLTNFQLSNQKSLAVKTPIMYLIMYLLVLAIYYFGAILIKNAFMVEKLALYGDMIVFASYAMQVISIFLMLSNIFSLLPRAVVSANRINEVLNTSTKIKNGKISKSKTNEVGSIEFKNVNFKYSDSKEMVLKNISFKINKGETVALVGSIGSGKTSLINLILRFFDVTDGEILINGINIKDYEQEFLNDVIGYIPQKPVIFRDTIKNNIIYGYSNKNKKKKERIDKVIDIIQNEKNAEFLNEKNAINGIDLSGGQKQKISIARAIIKKPEIYIFDEAFSGLDYGTDIDIINRLRVYDNNATILLISKKIDTIKRADKILVLDNGNCVGFGTHNELVKNCDTYNNIFFSQTKKEGDYKC